MLRGDSPSASETTPGDELRCDCGRLLARVVPVGIELRCGRCKATLVLPWGDIEGGEALVRRRASGSSR